MLTLITPTGDRPEAFKLCQQWMLQQDYKAPVRWVIADDGETPSNLETVKTGWDIAIVKLPFLNKNTQNINMTEALSHVTEKDKVVVIEDDDYYAPTWLSKVDTLLDTYDLVGEGNTIYYHVKLRSWRQNRHNRHASLCATALKGKAITILKEICRQYNDGIDHKLWVSRAVTNKWIDEHSNTVIGIKGLPGRPGIGNLHRNPKAYPNKDFNLSFFASLIGTNIKYYESFGMEPVQK